MKSYYTSIYNEGMIGEVLRHNTAEEAEKYLDKEWNRLTERERKQFRSGTADSFKAFEIEAAEEQLEQIEAGDITPEELETRMIKDMINGEKKETKDFKMHNGNMLEVGEEIRFADLWQSDAGDEEELLDSGCCWVGDDENGMPMIADFETLEKDEENLINSLVKIIDIR